MRCWASPWRGWVSLGSAPRADLRAALSSLMGAQTSGPVHHGPPGRRGAGCGQSMAEVPSIPVPPGVRTDLERRDLMHNAPCMAGAWAAAGTLPAVAGTPRSFAPSLLMDDRGDPLQAETLQPGEAWLFNYPVRRLAGRDRAAGQHRRVLGDLQLLTSVPDGDEQLHRAAQGRGHPTVVTPGAAYAALPTYNGARRRAATGP